MSDDVLDLGMSDYAAVTVDVGEEAGLRQLVRALRSEVIRLEKENVALKDQCATEVPPLRTADDFACALQQSLDTLQHRLGKTTNPTSDFAVKELRLDTEVHLEVSTLGLIGYRFPEYGRPVDRAALSRLCLTVVPVPKPGETAVLAQGRFTPDASVEEIHGVGEAYRRDLNLAGVFTIRELLATGSRVRSTAQLEAMLGVDRRLLGTWLQHAELLLVRDIDGRTASVLHDAGIVDLATLAGMKPAQVVARFNKVRVTQKRSGVDALTPETARAWIAAALLYVQARDGCAEPNDDGQE